MRLVPACRQDTVVTQVAIIWCELVIRRIAYLHTLCGKLLRLVTLHLDILH